MVVELDIFSGRPNPRWELDDSAARAVLEIEWGLSATSGALRQPPPLGYRGFLYAPRGEGTRRAFLGRVERRDGVLDDPDCSIEQMLLRSLPQDFAGLAERIAPLLSGQAGRD